MHIARGVFLWGFSIFRKKWKITWIVTNRWLVYRDQLDTRRMGGYDKLFKPNHHLRRNFTQTSFFVDCVTILTFQYFRLIHQNFSIFVDCVTVLFPPNLQLFSFYDQTVDFIYLCVYMHVKTFNIQYTMLQNPRIL